MSLNIDHQVVGSYQSFKGNGHSGLLLGQSGLSVDGIGDDIMSVFDRVDTVKDEVSRHVFIGTLNNGKKVFCKMYREAGVKAWLQRLVFSSKAAVAHQRVQKFIELGLPSPKSLGFIDSGGGAAMLSYHFCEYVEGADTLESGLRNNKLSPVMIGGVVTKVIDCLALLHDAHYCHGDTKLSNIICKETDIYFVDLDGFGTVSTKRKPERDIARFFVGLSELNVLHSGYAKLMDRYCGKRSIEPIAAISIVESYIDKFQRNHQKKYGRTPANIELKN